MLQKVGVLNLERFRFETNLILSCFMYLDKLSTIIELQLTSKIRIKPSLLNIFLKIKWDDSY